VCKAMGMKADFMEMAQNIRNSLSDNIQMITGKQSKYNKEKFISKCEVCMINVAVDTHHIKFQCSADKDTGMIGQWHKDNKFNLVGLCKECHQSVHSSPPRLIIDGYISTSQGIKLDYKRIDNNNKKIIVNVEQELQNNKDNSDEKIEKIIKNYKSRNMTPRQIQNRLKEAKITMTQKKIKSYF
jgi:DNA mismatch repair protein MutS